LGISNKHIVVVPPQGVVFDVLSSLSLSFFIGPLP
jgi:hypothetical protein